MGFEVFNENFFGDDLPGIQWFGKKGILDIGGDLNAEIVLTNSAGGGVPISGCYNGYEVRIVHRTQGLITRHDFGFEAHLREGPGPETCYDKLEVVASISKEQWYRKRPSFGRVRDMVGKITAFIDMHRVKTDVVPELVAEAKGLSLQEEDFDEAVHDAVSVAASNINNEGLESQIRFLVETCGEGVVRDILASSSAAPSA